MARVPEELLALIRRFEGLRLKAYRCPAGVWTIGYGQTAGIKPGMVWTKEQAEKDLRESVVKYIVATQKYCHTLDTDERLSAIADFCYNLGATRLKASTLRKKLNRRDWVGAQTELMKWVRGGGRVLLGLVLRRKAETALLDVGNRKSVAPVSASGDLSAKNEKRAKPPRMFFG